MNEQTRQRLLNLEALVEAGFAPYPYRFPKTHGAREILKAKAGAPPEAEWPEEEVALAGRLVALRRMGKVTFAHLLDETERIQLYFQKDLTPHYELLKKLDVGDILGVRGHPFTTKTGEVTVKVLAWTPLVKSLHPLPDKWRGGGRGGGPPRARGPGGGREAPGRPRGGSCAAPARRRPGPRGRRRRSGKAPLQREDPLLDAAEALPILLLLVVVAQEMP